MKLVTVSIFTKFPPKKSVPIELARISVLLLLFMATVECLTKSLLVLLRCWVDRWNSRLVLREREREMGRGGGGERESISSILASNWCKKPDSCYPRGIARVATRLLLCITDWETWDDRPGRYQNFREKKTIVKIYITPTTTVLNKSANWIFFGSLSRGNIYI